MDSKIIGIYLDHAHARLMESVSNALISQVIHSRFTHEEMEYTLSKSENVMHNKEQTEQTQYYEEIMNHIKDAKRILLFGPTTAKKELYNLMRDDDRFAGARIEVADTDKIQPNEQEDFLKEHFKMIN
jgi:stalled ribosome rescue protein Dom34